MAKTASPPATQTLEDLYNHACSQTTSDIYEHLPKLRELASRCRHITELGLRWASGSTVAFLAAQPNVLISWDVNPYAVISQSVLNLLCVCGKTRFEPRVGDSREITMEETDMIFFDTVHTAQHLKTELERHAFVPHCKAKKFLVFHDVAIYGQRGEDGKEPGLLGAISWFYKNNFPLWRPIYHAENNNGLLVLQREADWEKENGTSTD